MFLLNLAGGCNYLFNQNFEAKTIEIERKGGTLLTRIASRNGPNTIQVFSEAFASCSVLSALKLLGPECASFGEYVICAKCSFHLRK